MNKPEYMPEGTPELINNDPLNYRTIPGITFHREGDGILYYYDTPLLFIAYIGDQRVIVTLLDSEFNYPELPRKGWDQYLAIAISDELSLAIANSKVPVRDYWEQKSDNWFIHKDWEYIGEIEGKGEWSTEFKVFKNIPIKEEWKSTAGVVLNPKESKED